jgi:SAM-dependent methyltransferase
VFSKTAVFYDAVYSFKDYAAEASDVRALIESRKRSEGNELLDVACGTGLHLAHLRRHYRVEGLDEELLSIARERLPDVPLHAGDMTAFDLGKRFDAVVCLFSSIGYVGTIEGLHAAVECLARHTKPGGVVVVEPWLRPDVFSDGHLSSLFVDQPELKLARMSISRREGRLSIFDFEYLVGTAQGVERFSERHELALFTVEEHLEAFRAAGLDAEHDPEGPMGRGLYVAVKPV